MRHQVLVMLLRLRDWADRNPEERHIRSVLKRHGL